MRQLTITSAVTTMVCAHYSYRALTVLQAIYSDTGGRARFCDTGVYKLFIVTTVERRGTAVAQWLRCCATNQKVAGSIPGGVSGIFH